MLEASGCCIPAAEPAQEAGYQEYDEHRRKSHRYQARTHPNVAQEEQPELPECLSQNAGGYLQHCRGAAEHGAK